MNPILLLLPILAVATPKYYKSTMLPGEVSPVPAKDSMGMDMVPVYENAAASPGAVKVDAAMVQRMNLQTGVATRGPATRTLRAPGEVAYDEDGLHDVTTKFEGWIEKLHVSATGVAVGAGEPLFDIYSPDVYAAEMNYIVALRAEGSAGGPLTGAALERLRLLDVPAAAIADIARTGKAPRTIAVPAPAAGVVVAKSAVEGAMARPGEVLFRVADLSTVWVEARVYESDLADVAAGAAAEVRAPFGGGTDYRATVREILPEVEADTRTAGARLVLDNPGGRLRPGMYVEVLIPVSLSKDAVQIPESAVLRSGERDTVFVARDDGAFEPRDVTLGGRTGDGRYVVTRGLSGGERVVISGQFLLDAESRYQEAVQKMLSAPH